MNLFDQITLLLTGLTAIYLLVRFYQDFKSSETKPTYNYYYMASFFVLLVAGLLLIFLGWDILPNPLVVVVTTLLPLGVAQGLVCEFYKKSAKLYLAVALIGFILIVLSRYGIIGGSKLFLPIFHTFYGLTIFFIPILVVRAKKAPAGFLFVTVGGTLIGLGGIALAFLVAGKQLLFFSGDFVMMILAPLLLLMALAYTWGFVKKIKA